MGGVAIGPKCGHGLDASSCMAEKKFEKNGKPKGKRKKFRKRNI